MRTPICERHGYRETDKSRVGVGASTTREQTRIANVMATLAEGG